MQLSKAPKIPRNSVCSCGSGKKYKKCCLIKQEEQSERQLEIKRMLDSDKVKEVIQDTPKELTDQENKD